MAPDKKLHFIGGIIIAVIVDMFTWAGYGFFAAVVAGWLKELWDFYHPATHTYDSKDARYTAYGGLAWVAFVVIFGLVRAFIESI